MKRVNGKRYASLDTLRTLRGRGYAVVEPGSLFEPATTYYWHRVEQRARERVRQLRHRGRTAYFVTLARDAGVESVSSSSPSHPEEN